MSKEIYSTRKEPDLVGMLPHEFPQQIKFASAIISLIRRRVRYQEQSHPPFFPPVKFLASYEDRPDTPSSFKITAFNEKIEHVIEAKDMRFSR